MKKLKNKKYRTLINQMNSKKLNPKPQMKIETLDNKVLPKKTIIEIGSGKDKRTIDISQYLIK